MKSRAYLSFFFILAVAYSSMSGLITPTHAQTASAQGPFYRDLKLGDYGPDVLALQKILNYSGSTIALSGAGSPGNETQLFGTKTQRAVIDFQERNRTKILIPAGLTSGTGYVGLKSRTLLTELYILHSASQIASTTPITTQPQTQQPATTFATSSTILIYYPSTYESFVGKTVTISGVGFTEKGNNLIFSKNGKRVHTITDITSPTGTSLSFRVPNLPNDRYDVNLTNTKGTSRSMTFLVILDDTVPRKAPQITSISPSSAAYGTPVTLYGENLVATENYLVTNYGIVENATSSPDNTNITFTLTPFKDVPQVQAGNLPKQNLTFPVFVHLVNKNGVSNVNKPGTFTITL